MFSPIKWIKPRLKTLCITFGATDMTLVILSVFGWYFFFDVAHRARQNIYVREIKGHTNMHPTADIFILHKTKEESSTDDLRFERTSRACGLTDIESIAADDTSFAGPAALIGAAMGGYFVLGALLTTLGSVDYPAARKTICTVSLVGEGLCTFFLVIATSLLFADDGMCETEYYYESFQPLSTLLAFNTVFIFSYKMYEITILAFYFSDQSKALEKDETMKILESGGRRTSAAAQVASARSQESEMSINSEADYNPTKPVTVNYAQIAYETVKSVDSSDLKNSNMPQNVSDFNSDKSKEVAEDAQVEPGDEDEEVETETDSESDEMPHNDSTVPTDDIKTSDAIVLHVEYEQGGMAASNSENNNLPSTFNFNADADPKAVGTPPMHDNDKANSNVQNNNNLSELLDVNSDDEINNVPINLEDNCERPRTTSEDATAAAELIVEDVIRDIKTPRKSGSASSALSMKSNE